MTSRTGPRRSESARLAVLNAADDLLVERGFDGVTIEGIAARAGVAKQTIYRWWHSKVEILLDTIADDAPEALAWPEEPGVPEEDLRRQLRRVIDFFGTPPGQVMLALLGHAQHDARTAAAFREGFLREQRERDKAGLRAVAERHTGRPLGEQDAERLLDLLLGPVYYRILVFGHAPEPEFTDRLADFVLDMAGRPAG